jgi:hypothetical protein
MLSIWCEHAMETGQVGSRPGYQGCQAHHKIQWLEDDVGSAISIRRLQLVADVAARMTGDAGFFNRPTRVSLNWSVGCETGLMARRVEEAAPCVTVACWGCRSSPFMHRIALNGGSRCAIFAGRFFLVSPQ